MVGVIKMIDLVGNRYGKLVVMNEEQPIVWRNGKKSRRFKCLCDCGKTTIVSFSAIVYGFTKSCGCLKGKSNRRRVIPGMYGSGSLSETVEGGSPGCDDKPAPRVHSENESGNIKPAVYEKLRSGGVISVSCDPRDIGKKEKHHNLIGNRYGMLTVVGKAEKTRPDMSNHLRFWECVCDCGNRSVVFQGNLLTGATRSCGCINTRTWRGKRFGKLTILSAAPIVHNMRYWNVRCDCGRIHTVSRDVLFRAANVYCDCGSDKPRIDLAWQVFGRLTVLMRVDPVIAPSGRREKSWLCRCVCGREVVVYQKHLLNKNTRSCGCLKRYPNLISETKLTGKADV